MTGLLGKEFWGFGDNGPELGLEMLRFAGGREILGEVK